VESTVGVVGFNSPCPPVSIFGSGCVYFLPGRMYTVSRVLRMPKCTVPCRVLSLFDIWLID